MLPRFLRHLLPQFEHIQRGHRDGDSPVEYALPGHLGVDYLQAETRGRPSILLQPGVNCSFRSRRPLSPKQGTMDTPCTWPTPGPELQGKRSPRTSSSTRIGIYCAPLTEQTHTCHRVRPTHSVVVSLRGKRMVLAQEAGGCGVGGSPSQLHESFS